MIRRLLSGLFAAAFLACLLPAAANAQCGYRYPMGGEFYGARGFGVSGSLYGLGYVPVPPYFAVHPPVYYTYPVGRTYGYSPFAYSGDTPTPEVAPPKPQEILNPHVKPDAKSDAKPDELPKKKTAAGTTGKVTAAPLVVRNPFVLSDSPAAEATAAAQPAAVQLAP